MIYTRNLITNDKSVENYNNSVAQINKTNYFNMIELQNLYDKYKTQNDTLNTEKDALLKSMSGLSGNNKYIRQMIQAVR